MLRLVDGALASCRCFLGPHRPCPGITVSGLVWKSNSGLWANLGFFAGTIQLTLLYFAGLAGGGSTGWPFPKAAPMAWRGVA